MIRRTGIKHGQNAREIVDMVFYEMKSYFYEYIYKDDLEFKNNFQSIFNRFLTEMINNIINSKIDGGEKYDITSLKNGIK